MKNHNSNQADSPNDVLVLHLLEDHPKITIVKIDSRFHAEYVSPSVTKILGYSPEYFLGKTVLDVVHEDDTERLQGQIEEAIAAGTTTLESEYRVVTESNETVWIETRARLFYDTDGAFAGAVYVQSDVTGRKLQEEQLKRALRDKDYLMKELNHRVKNNLAIVSSLVGLKTNEGNPEFTEIQKQIDAIGLIHEKLYESDNVLEIHFRAYIESVIESIIASFTRMPVRVEMRVDDVDLPSKTATNLGLIVNELVINAIKYGFSENKEPVLRVSMNMVDDENQWILSVSNNGNVFPEEVGLDTSSSMGLQLVAVLSSQIGGTVTLEKQPYTTFCVKFPTESA